MIYADGHKLIDDSDWANTALGTNLVLDSKGPFAIECVNKTNQLDKNWELSKDSKSFPDNLRYIALSYDYVLSSDFSGNVKIQFNNAPWDLNGNQMALNTENKAGRFAKVIDLTQTNGASWADWKNRSFTGICLREDNAIGTITISKIKLEIGTQITNWSPAPEDLVTKSDLDDLKAQIEQLKSK